MNWSELQTESIRFMNKSSHDLILISGGERGDMKLDKKVIEQHNKERRSSSFVEAMFSRDAVKIRADILKNIPLTAPSSTPNTISKTCTSASISSTDSVKSTPSQIKHVAKTKEKLVRRKSSSLDGE